jgi:hypothetical protein
VVATQRFATRVVLAGGPRMTTRRAVRTWRVSRPSDSPQRVVLAGGPRMTTRHSFMFGAGGFPSMRANHIVVFSRRVVTTSDHRSGWSWRVVRA